MKLQSEFSREFFKNNFRPFAAPIASAARCGPHPRTPLATPLCKLTPTSGRLLCLSAAAAAAFAATQHESCLIY